MSDMTIKEALQAKAKAEQEISLILDRLVRYTCATYISSTIDCVTSHSLDAVNADFNYVKFKIRLEI